VLIWDRKITDNNDNLKIDKRKKDVSQIHTKEQLMQFAEMEEMELREEKDFLEESLKKLEGQKRALETQLLKLPQNARTLVQKMKIRSLEVELDSIESKIGKTKQKLKALRN
jgi:hypothetical protein